MKTFLIRGLPQALQQDGWWMEAQPPADRPRQGAQGRGEAWHIAVLLGLIVLGDVLIWQVIPGVSLAVFGAALVLAAVWVTGRRLPPKMLGLIAGGTVLVLLPLVEMVNPLTFLIGFAGVSILLAVIAGLKPAQLALGVLRLWPMGMLQTVMEGEQFARGGGKADMARVMGRLVMAWLMPLALGLVFALLLLLANPVADRWVNDLLQTGIFVPDMARLFFWLTLVPFVWTALSVCRMRASLGAALPPARFGPARAGLINPASVTRALLLFNVLFAVQTGLDVIYLYGGVGLPEGISHASYAHRGAYPLVVTALLAGGFALLTQAWVQRDPVLRALLVLFVAQNVALVFSALVRLDMYVDVFGLTRMRVAAGIWMGLTAGGLALILWQVVQRHRNGWLMVRGAALTAGVLYLTAWVPFDAVIAQHNLSRPLSNNQSYLCGLGDAAKPALAAHRKATGRALCRAAALRVRSPADWREWGWRNARARNTLGAVLENEDHP